MRLKLIKWLFIPICCILLMSHNSYALELDYDVSSLWNGSTPASTEWIYSDGGGSLSASGNFICGAGSDVRRKVWGIILNFTNSISGTVKAGDLIEFRIALTADSNSNMNIDFAPVLYDYYGNFDIIDVNYQNAGHSSSQVKIIAMARSNGVHTLYLRRDNYSNPFFSMINTNGVECATSGVWTLYRIKGDGAQAIINAINNNNSSQAINDAKDAIVGAINQQQQKEQQATDNIQNQTPPASGSGENSQTTSLLNTLGSFLSAITNLSATDCNVVLEFPSFAGGSQTVNICQNKEYSGNIVSIAGSIILVMFYLPVAFMLVSKIYSEIRSFTNG